MGWVMYAIILIVIMVPVCVPFGAFFIYLAKNIFWETEDEESDLMLCLLISFVCLVVFVVFVVCQSAFSP